MQQVPENILESFQGKYPHPDSKLIPHHLGEEGSDGAIYRFRDRDVLLKICHLGQENIRQDQKRFGKRLDFLNFLFERGVPVVEPFPSLSDKLYETADENGGCWVAYAMKYIRGKAPSPKAWTPDFLNPGVGRSANCIKQPGNTRNGEARSILKQVRNCLVGNQNGRIFITSVMNRTSRRDGSIFMRN